MACCCKCGKSNKSNSSCLGRCDLPKHRCLIKDEVKPGPVPRNMGWLYTAIDAPEHQLRCGWRPGHISCLVLRRIEAYKCMKYGDCGSCSTTCKRPPCSTPRCLPPPCYAVCPATAPCPKLPCSAVAPYPKLPCSAAAPCAKLPSSPAAPCPKLPCSAIAPCPKLPCSATLSCSKIPNNSQPIIRIVRHAGQYSICIKPSTIISTPAGPFPLKYVLNTDGNDGPNKNKLPPKFSVEAKYNDNHFDYTSSQSSFVLDFSPPEPARCYKPCGA